MFTSSVGSARGPAAAWALAVAVTLALAVPPAAADAAKTKGWTPAAKAELKALQGVWEVVKAGDAADEPPKGFAFTFKGTEATMALGGKSESARVHAIDPTTDPKCIDLVETRPDKSERTLEGVYRIDGDTLRLAFSVSKEGKSRPTGFEKPTDPRTLVLTLKRVKG